MQSIDRPHAPVMTALRLLSVVTATMFCMTAFAGQDAAQEVQEGNVKQWMEYYERERGRAEQRDGKQEAAVEKGQPSSENVVQPGDAEAPDAAVTRPADGN